MESSKPSHHLTGEGHDPCIPVAMLAVIVSLQAKLRPVATLELQFFLVFILHVLRLNAARIWVFGTCAIENLCANRREI